MSYHDSNRFKPQRRLTPVNTNPTSKDRRLSQLEGALQEIAAATTDDELKEKIRAVLKEQE